MLRRHFSLFLFILFFYLFSLLATKRLAVDDLYLNFHSLKLDRYKIFECSLASAQLRGDNKRSSTFILEQLAKVGGELLLVGLEEGECAPLLVGQQAGQLGPAGGQVGHAHHGGQLFPGQDPVLHNAGEQAEFRHLLLVAQDLGRLQGRGEEEGLLNKVAREFEPVVQELFPLGVLQACLA
jgi:hypothetical protein